jgi:predicted GNAT family acetyltransferase
LTKTLILLKKAIENAYKSNYGKLDCLRVQYKLNLEVKKVILKLDSSYKKQLLEFLWEEKEINLFIIGDVETYGFDEKIVSYWADFHENGEMTAVLMKFYEDFTVYSRSEFDVLGFSKIIKENNFKVLSGEKSVVEKFANHIEIIEKRNMYFAKLYKSDNLYNGTLSDPVRPTKLEDVIKIYELQRVYRNQGQHRYTHSSKNLWIPCL